MHAARLPSLRAIRYFAVAATTLSFTKAAEILNVTQSAVSRQVQLLEDELGVSLFIRRTRSLVLTPPGEAFLLRLSEAFDIIETGVEEVRAAGRRSIVTISLPPTFAVRWGMQRIIAFQEQRPDTEIRVQVDPTGRAFDAGDVDVAVEFIYARNRRPHAHELFLESLTPICAPAYAAQLKAEPPASALANARLLHVRQADGRYVDWRNWLRLAGHHRVSYERGLVLDTADMTLDAAKSGAGVAVGDTAFIMDDVKAGSLAMPFEAIVTLDRGYFITARQQPIRNPIIKDLVEHMIAESAPLRQVINAE